MNRRAAEALVSARTESSSSGFFGFSRFSCIALVAIYFLWISFGFVPSGFLNDDVFVFEISLCLPKNSG